MRVLGCEFSTALQIDLSSGSENGKSSDWLACEKKNFPTNNDGATALAHDDVAPGAKEDLPGNSSPNALSEETSRNVIDDKKPAPF